MGQKVNPIGLRLGITEDWRSRWYAGKKLYSQQLIEDLGIRKHIQDRLKRAGISRVEIERFGDKIRIDIFTARPGIVIGKRGSEVDELRTMLEKRTEKQVQVNIQEIKRPEIDAVLVAQNVADQLEARVSFRRAMKKAVQLAMKSGAKGIRVQCGGRLGGSEMSRSEWYREGRVPLHTLRADVDYGTAESLTTFGRIGVKVWIYKGEILSPAEVRERRAERARQGGEGDGDGGRGPRGGDGRPRQTRSKASERPKPKTLGQPVVVAPAAEVPADSEIVEPAVEVTAPVEAVVETTPMVEAPATVAQAVEPEAAEPEAAPQAAKPKAAAPKAKAAKPKAKAADAKTIAPEKTEGE
jgi:small subunit ribosomal protein S3